MKPGFWTTMVGAVALLAAACGGSKSGSSAPPPVPPGTVRGFSGLAAGSQGGYRVALGIPALQAAGPRGGADLGGSASLTSIDFNVTLMPMVIGGLPVTFHASYVPETGAMSGLGADANGVSYGLDALLSNGEITGRLSVNTHNPPGRLDDFFPLALFELNTFDVIPYCGTYGTGGAVGGKGVFCLMVAGRSGVLGVSQLGTLRGTLHPDGSLALDIHALDTQATIGTATGSMNAADAGGTWQLAAAGGDCAGTPALCGGWVASASGCDFAHVAGLSFAGFTTGGTPAGGILQFTLGSGTSGAIPAYGGFATQPSSSNNVDSLFPSSNFDYGTGDIALHTFANASGSLNLSGVVIDGTIVNGTYHYDESGTFGSHTSGLWYAYPSTTPIQGYCGSLVAADSTVLGQLYLYAGSRTIIGQGWPGPSNRPSTQLPAIVVGTLGGSLPLSFQQFDGSYTMPTGTIAVTGFTPGSQISGTWSDGAAGAASTWTATRCRP